MKGVVFVYTLAAAVCIAYGLDCYECSYAKGTNTAGEENMHIAFSNMGDAGCEDPDDDELNAVACTDSDEVCVGSIYTVTGTYNGSAAVAYKVYQRYCGIKPEGLGSDCFKNETVIESNENDLEVGNFTNIQITSDGECYCSTDKCNDGHQVAGSLAALVAAVFLLKLTV